MAEPEGEFDDPFFFSGYEPGRSTRRRPRGTAVGTKLNPPAKLVYAQGKAVFEEAERVLAREALEVAVGSKQVHLPHEFWPNPAQKPILLMVFIDARWIFDRGMQKHHSFAWSGKDCTDSVPGAHGRKTPPPETER